MFAKRLAGHMRPIEIPTLGEVDQALQQLNGTTRRVLTIHGDGEAYLYVACNGVKYYCFGTIDNYNFSTLSNSTNDDTPIEIVLDDSTHEVQARHLVSRVVAFQAARSFAESGIFLPSLLWDHRS